MFQTLNREQYEHVVTVFNKYFGNKKIITSSVVDETLGVNAVLSQGVTTVMIQQLTKTLRC